jgi:hypothetical protein
MPGQRISCRRTELGVEAWRLAGSAKSVLMSPSVDAPHIVPQTPLRHFAMFGLRNPEASHSDGEETAGRR